MKIRLMIALVFAALVFAVPNLFQGQAREATGPVASPPPLSNPLKVALLKWYQLNQVPTSFPVGQQPYGIAFDGANM